jgi:diketogulonate reductase-like aldo/keto reductase
MSTKATPSKIGTLNLPSGEPVPVLGQGTWGFGEDQTKRRAEIAALRLGLDLGMTMIDTAEMYGEGASEELIGEAIEGRRAEVFLVSKVYPHHATRSGALQACERSLNRLKTDHLDLYLLHWIGSVPLAETLEAFQSLKQAGKIRQYGVSNFDRSDMEEAVSLSGGGEIVTDQVLYNLQRRGIEWDLLPWCRDHGIPVMAYSPFEHSASEHTGMLAQAELKSIASRHNATAVQVALAWILRQTGVIAIPKASSIAHVRENREATKLVLTDQDLSELDRAFPPPRHKAQLEMR